MPLRHIGLALLVPLIWGMGFVFAKGAMSHFPPVLLMAFRFTVTAIIFVWFVKPPWPIMGRIFLLASVGATLQYGLVFGGLKYLDASTTVLLVQLEVPYLILLGVLFLKERLVLRKVLGIILSFGGVFLIAGEPRLNDAYFAIGMVMAGGVLWAIGQILARTLGNKLDGFTLIIWVAVFAAPELFLISWYFEEEQLEAIRDATINVWATVIYLGVVMTTLAYTIWYKLLATYQVNQVAPYLLLIPVFSILGSVLVLGETVTTNLITGGVIVMAGVAIIAIQKPVSESA
ncbi:MAG: DMT family transporter [Arenicellales bacterium WSBS_2016_MAG_OTU3]